MRMPEQRYTFHRGYYWIDFEAAHAGILKGYIDSVLRGTLPADEYWSIIAEEHADEGKPESIAESQRTAVEGGLIVKLPEKPAESGIVPGELRWIMTGGQWIVGQAERRSMRLALDDHAVFLVMNGETMRYDDIEAIGPVIEPYGEDEDDHGEDGHGRCPLCPTDETLAAMRSRNIENAGQKRRQLAAEIEADPSAFVHIVEGYDDVHDRSPVIMFVASKVDEARRRMVAIVEREGVIAEVTPHRIDSDRTGEVVMTHASMRDGVIVVGEGRFQRKEPRS